MATPTPSTPLRILMLHGFTQSGPLFRAKTRALEKNLQKAFPQGANLIYPTAPMRLNRSDLPWEVPSEDGEELDAWSWWTVTDRTKTPYLYGNLDIGLGRIAKVLEEMGPFDGVVGFSQGGGIAAMVASLLEIDRPAAFKSYAGRVKGATWTDVSLTGTEFANFQFEPATYPECFLNSEGKQIHPPLKFAVAYSGFASNHPSYGAYYYPKIATPLLAFIGSVDTVVKEDRTLLLTAACVDSKVVYHPGGHFVPASQKEFVGHLVGFVKDVMSGSRREVLVKQEQSVEDMDMPF